MFRRHRKRLQVGVVLLCVLVILSVKRPPNLKLNLNKILIANENYATFDEPHPHVHVQAVHTPYTNIGDDLRIQKSENTLKRFGNNTFSTKVESSEINMKEKQANEVTSKVPLNGETLTHSPSLADLKVVASNKKSFMSFRDIANFPFNCSNLNEIEVRKFHSMGEDKAAFYGIYWTDTTVEKVAVKTIKNVVNRACLNIFEKFVNRPILDLANAIREDCVDYAMQQFLLEIVYHAALKSDSIVSMLGFCLHGVPETLPPMFEAKFQNQSTPSIVSIFEFGQVMSARSIGELPYRQRLQYCKDVAPLLDQMNSTILGPVTMIDLVPRHYLIVKGRMTIYDLGLFYHGHPPCGIQTENSFKLWHYSEMIKKADECAFHVPCSNGYCIGLHYIINRYIFKIQLIYIFLGKDHYNVCCRGNQTITSTGIISYIDKELKKIDSKN